MWYLLPTLFDHLFPKYKALPFYSTNKDKWVINKRKFLLFYSPLTHTKSVIHTGWIRPYVRRNDVLLFNSEEEAQDEIDRLNFGHPAIVYREWYNHKMIEERYEK